MNALSFNSTRHKLQYPTISCPYKPPKTSFSVKIVPARDRIIDFGKFKGKMLGTLPSTYLKWVSKNLRARDFEEWAKLADEVLSDPVYKDRIEWEFAEKVLNGDVLTSPLLQKGNDNAVRELFEISERFGWDNEDKAAWSKIDFKLLGTSKGGRIPRIDENRGVAGTTRELKSLNLSHNKNTGRKMRSKGLCDREVMERRKERRERIRLSSNSNGSRMHEEKERMGIEDNEKGSFGIVEKIRLKGNQDINGQDRVMEVQSRFPGREGLLKKVLNRHIQ